jgi:hypothetical protein
MSEFNHVAKNLQEEKKVVFTAQSCKNFHQRMLICKHAFEKGAIPINPFNVFGYYLYELVERDLVRNGNNNLMKRCDELWLYDIFLKKFRKMIFIAQVFRTIRKEGLIFFMIMRIK